LKPEKNDVPVISEVAIIKRGVSVRGRVCGWQLCSCRHFI